MFNEEFELLNLKDKDIEEKFKGRKKGSQDYYIIDRFKKKYDNPVFEVIKLSIPVIKDINHPNILQLIDFKEDSEYYYFIYEYCDGGNLDDYLKYLKKNNKSLTEEEVQHIMKQLVETVKYLHNKKIVHRNMKPRNILIKYDSEEDLLKRNLLKSKIKLAGFTISSHLKKGEYLNIMAGTKKYMAPEISKGKLYNEKIDIWNLGVIFSELLSCDVSFYPGQSNYYYEGKYFPNISKEANSFLQCMLKLDPEKRKNADTLSKHDFLIKDVKNFSFEN